MDEPLRTAKRGLESEPGLSVGRKHPQSCDIGEGVEEGDAGKINALGHGDEPAPPDLPGGRKT